MPRILIEISDGIVTVTSDGDVDVLIADYDVGDAEFVHETENGDAILDHPAVIRDEKKINKFFELGETEPIDAWERE